MPNEKSLQDRLEKQRELLDKARNPDSTPFDYIVVGSGAGGGPLAARLALAGKRVLVLEAGLRPRASRCARRRSAQQSRRLDRRRMARGLSGSRLSRQRDRGSADELGVLRAPLRRPGQAKEGHEIHSRITSGDRQRRNSVPALRRAGRMHLALRHDRRAPERLRLGSDRRMTGDDSWRSSAMQGYFTLIEKCLYNSVYQGFFAATRTALHGDQEDPDVRQPEAAAGPGRARLLRLADHQLHQPAADPQHRERRFDLSQSAFQDRSLPAAPS